MNPADLFTHETNPVRLAPGEYLFKSGDAPNGMFVVLDGTLEVVVDDTVVETAQRGSIIGEMSLIDDSPRGASIVARQPSSLAQVDAHRFQRMIQQNPFFATHVMRVLVERIRRLDQLLAQIKTA